MQRLKLPLLAASVLLLAILACVREQTGPVLIVTATAESPLGIDTRLPDDSPRRRPSRWGRNSRRA